MKVTKAQLKQIIKEELEALAEGTNPKADPAPMEEARQRYQIVDSDGNSSIVTPRSHTLSTPEGSGGIGVDPVDLYKVISQWPGIVGHRR